MPRGILLTKFRKGKAIANKKRMKTIREIAGILKIGKSAIAEYLMLIEKGKKTGRPQKVIIKKQRNLLQQLKKIGTSLTAQCEFGWTYAYNKTDSV